MTLTNTDARPVQRAAVLEIADQFGPLKWLDIRFPLPGGGLRLTSAWTPGGDRLGDEIDTVALAAGMDMADWLAIVDRHHEVTYRGKIQIVVHDLPPIRNDVALRYGADRDFRGRLRAAYAEWCSEWPFDWVGLPRWHGVGPYLLGGTTQTEAP
jgi:hypothetical protein